jgi:hypothetical protein
VRSLAGAGEPSDYGNRQLSNPQFAIRNPQSATRNPQSPELPPAREEPLARTGGAFSRMGYRERFLAEQLLASEEVFVIARTGTKIDVGSWLLRGRVWVFALADSLAIVACGPAGLRVHAEKIPYEELRGSQYNHVTGELALAPVKGLPFRGLRIDPVTGCQILAQIHRED